MLHLLNYWGFYSKTPMNSFVKTSICKKMDDNILINSFICLTLLYNKTTAHIGTYFFVK